MDISRRIRTRREALELSQTDLANAIGHSPAIISHYERGERSPSLEVLRLLASALRCKPGDLIDPIAEPPMVLCPTCCGRGVVCSVVAVRMRNERFDKITQEIHLSEAFPDREIHLSEAFPDRLKGG